MLEGLIAGLGAIFNIHGATALVLGVLYGIIFGALPGLGATIGVALLVPFTYDIAPATAMVLMISVYVGAEYGGAISAILLSIPGTAAAAATVLDGYPMARRGQAALALEISLRAGCVAGLLSAFVCFILLEPLANMALMFGPPAYFALALLALLSVASLGADSPLKGLLAATLGLAIASVGLDPITGIERFTLGFVELEEGVPILAVIIGLFAISEAFHMMHRRTSTDDAATARLGTTYMAMRQWLALAPATLRGTLIGIFAGILPGVGATAAAWFAYDVERRMSPQPERFGKGAPEGIAAPEAANNSTVGGALVPMLALGIPGSPTIAVLIGALVLHGLQPGPMMVSANPGVAYGLIVAVFVSVLPMYVLGHLMIPFSSQIIRLPDAALTAVILTISIVGMYLVRGLMFDVWLAVLFGIIGYFFKIVKIPAAPVILAIVVYPIVESNFRRSLLLSREGYAIFITDRLSLMFLSIGIALVGWSLVHFLRRTGR